MLNFLSGKKTYVTVFLAILLIVLEKLAGIDIPGFEVGDDWMVQIAGLLGLGTLRAGVAKSNST